MATRPLTPALRYALLSRLWLHEPDAETITRAVNGLGLPNALPAQLASEYVDVFLLNVPPYGTIFTDAGGEMNGLEAQGLAALYEAHGYAPPELEEVGAPDHIGLCLGFLAHLEEKRSEIGVWAFDWMPLACLAVEREPTASAFYRSLAAQTRALLLAHPALRSAPLANSLPLLSFEPQEELSLHDLVRFFLAPARCGMFLSRSRLGQIAKALGMRLSFGTRFEVAESLFTSAGETHQVEALIDALETESTDWRSAYRQWAEKYPLWRSRAEAWLARAEAARHTLAEMRATAAEMLT